MNNLTEADLEIPVVWTLFGALMVLLQTTGLALVLKWRAWPKLIDALKTALILGMVFALPLAGYPLSYTPEHNVLLFIINASNYVLGWVLSATILSGLHKLQDFTQQSVALRA